MTTTRETTRVERRLVLADDADRAVLERYAVDHGWSLANTVPWSFAGAEQRSWLGADGTEVLYAEMHSVGGRLLSVYADAEVADRLAGELRSVVPTVSVDAVFAVLTAEPAAPATEALRALGRLQLACLVVGEPPEAVGDDRLPDAFSRVVGHPDPAVRLMAVILAADLVRYRSDLVDPVLAHRDDNAGDPDLLDLFEAFRDIAAGNA